MREVKLPSGAILKVAPASFAVSKALYQALLKELKGMTVSATTDVTSFYKDLFCIGFSSTDIEAKIWECFKRCTYNTGAGDLKITEDTFEPHERRDDYMQVCIEVVKENVAPFAKSLYAEYSHGLAMTVSTQK